MADTAAIVATARSKLGAPYVWGAEGPDKFDCSGFLQWVFAQHGIKLPRVSHDQATVGTEVTGGMANWRPGDMVFTDFDGQRAGVDHAALYIGDGQIISAPRAGDVVKVSTVGPKYLSHLVTVRRYGGTGGGGGGAPLPSLPGVPDGLVKGVQEAAGALRNVAGGVTAVGGLAQKLMWFALPTTQVRLVSGVLGAGFLLLGIVFLAREVRRS